MKVLTEARLRSIDTRLASALASVEAVEAEIRGAHRTSSLRFDVRWAAKGLKSALAELAFNEKLNSPPRTRKVERMERTENKKGERHVQTERQIPY